MSVSSSESFNGDMSTSVSPPEELGIDLGITGDENATVYPEWANTDEIRAAWDRLVKTDQAKYNLA